jgi:hypothetical protein
MMMMMIVSMGRDVSELRPPTGLLLSTHVILRVLSHGNYDDNAGFGNLLTRPPELSCSPASRIIWEQVGTMDGGVRILRISI